MTISALHEIANQPRRILLRIFSRDLNTHLAHAAAAAAQASSTAAAKSSRAALPRRRGRWHHFHSDAAFAFGRAFQWQITKQLAVTGAFRFVIKGPLHFHPLNRIA